MSSEFGDRHIIVTGMAFGDESKGALVDWLCATLPDVSLVVRYNGGAQAAHNVVAEGKHHTFRQFGSGTLAGVPTFLSRYMMVEPMALAAESEELAALGVVNPLGMVTVDPDALLTTPIHVAVNRTREDARGNNRHGSCGLGIGETTWYDLAARRNAAAGDVVEGITVPSDVRAYAPRVGDCLNPRELRNKLVELGRFYSPILRGSRHGFPPIDSMVEVYRAFAEAVHISESGYLARMGRYGRLIFEGAQGVLLDEWRGFHPYTTWSTTTPDNAKTLLHEAGLPPAYVLGALRAYGTRHGAGPFPSETNDPQLVAAEQHNGLGEYQGAWRVGDLDMVLLRYAAAVAGPIDGIALSHLDVPTSGNVTMAYMEANGPVDDLPVGRHGDLRFQEILTDSITPERVDPGFTGYVPFGPLAAPADPREAIEELGLPVVVEARGPAREDRAFALALLST
jgi:adenylosuccinate synthase